MLKASCIKYTKEVQSKENIFIYSTINNLLQAMLCFLKRCFQLDNERFNRINKETDVI